MELQWCSDHGLPHSALLEWSPEDRAKLAAFLLESNSKCQLCGTADWEWEEDRHAYEPIARQCWGCYYKDRASESEDKMPGMTVTLVPSSIAEKQRNIVHKSPTARE
jgi:hypothetical protein